MEDKEIIILHKLTYINNNSGVLIGRYGTDTFAEFPEDGATLLRKLEQGMNVSEAKTWYQRTYEEEIDIEDFIKTLDDLTFIQNEKNTQHINKNIKWEKFSKVFFSVPFMILHITIIFSALFILFTYPNLIPVRENIFFSKSTTIIMIGLFVGQLPGIFFHELMHFFAARRLGIKSKFGIGRRMYFIVFTTSIPGVWGIPKHKRYFPFLVGMLGDILWFSFLIITAGSIYFVTGEITFIISFCLALAFTTLLRLVWQFYFHLQTDIYYVIITMLGCINLQEASRAYIKYNFLKFIGKKNTINFEKYTTRDNRVARWYSIFYVIGWSLSVAILLYMFPIFIEFCKKVYFNMVEGSDLYLWDSLVFFSLTFFQLSVVLYLYIKEKRIKNKNQIHEMNVSTN